jgi:hypothetical protein
VLDPVTDGIVFGGVREGFLRGQLVFHTEQTRLRIGHTQAFHPVEALLGADKADFFKFWYVRYGSPFAFMPGFDNRRSFLQAADQYCFSDCVGSYERMPPSQGQGGAIAKASISIFIASNLRCQHLDPALENDGDFELGSILSRDRHRAAVKSGIGIDIERQFQYLDLCDRAVSGNQLQEIVDGAHCCAIVATETSDFAMHDARLQQITRPGCRRRSRANSRFGCRCIAVMPLKALQLDIRRNVERAADDREHGFGGTHPGANLLGDFDRMAQIFRARWRIGKLRRDLLVLGLIFLNLRCVIRAF